MNTFQIRRVCDDDFARGHLELLGQLADVGSVSIDTYRATLATMSARGSQIFVVHDTVGDTVVACATLLTEQKLIHSCACVGHIEDVVVSSVCRGKGLGQKLIEHVVDEAKAQGCYKVILDCTSANAGFYEKCGFFKNEIQMRQNC